MLTVYFDQSDFRLPAILQQLFIRRQEPQQHTFQLLKWNSKYSYLCQLN